MRLRNVERLRRELLALPPGRQVVCVRNHRRYQGRELCEALLAECWELRFADPTRSALEARTAKTLADAAGLDDLRVVARSRLANALRIRGRFREAERVLDEAFSLPLGRDQAADAIRSERLAVLASLRFAQGRSPEGKEIAEKALTYAERSGELARCVPLLLQLALAVSDWDAVQALRLVTRAIRLIRPEETRLRLIAHHNAAELLVMVGRPDQAARVLEFLNELYAAVSEPSIEARRLHLSGTIARGLRFHSLAEQQFRAAIEAYSACSQPHLVAVAALELASFLPRDRVQDIRALVSRAMASLEATGGDSMSSTILRILNGGDLDPAVLSRAAAILSGRAA